MNKKQIIRRSSWSLAIAIAAVALLASRQPAEAVFQPAEADPSIINLTATPASTTPGATTTYTVEFTVPDALPAGSNLNFFFQSNGCPQGMPFSQCQYNIAGANYSSGMGGSGNVNEFGVGIMFDSGLASGAKSFTLSNVVNPAAGGMYVLNGMSSEPGDEPCNGPGCPLSEAQIYLGTILVKGRVTNPSAEGVPFAYVQVFTQDFSVNAGSGTSTNGYYGIPAGSLGNGTYNLSVFPPGGPDAPQGIVAPDPVQITYAGTTLVRDLAFIQAAKTLTGRVTYASGGNVTTAQISANKGQGGGGSRVQTNVDSDGEFSLSMSGGCWDLNLEPQWGQNGQISVDWVYNGDRIQVCFAENNNVESKTQNFVTQRATARVNGRIVKPNGDPVSNSWVQLEQSAGRGNGASTDNEGDFSIPAVAGTYRLFTWSNDPTMYLDPVVVTVADNETKNLGTIRMGEKNSSIRGTVVDNDGNPIEGLNVNAFKFEGQGWGNGSTDSDGRFSIPVFAGRWGVEARSQQYISNGPPLEVNVGNNANVNVGEIVLTVADASVRLNAIDDDGNALTNLFGFAHCRNVNAGFGPGGFFGGPLDRGSAVIPVIGDATYECNIGLPPDVDYSADEPAELDVNEGQTVTANITLLPNDAEIRILLQDQNADPVTGQAEAFVMDKSFNWRGTPLNGDGSAIISVRSGNEYFPGYHFRDPNSGYLNTHPDQTNPLTPDAGETLTVVLTAFKADAQVNATVLDPNGDPVQFGFFGASNRFIIESEGKPTGDFDRGRVIDTGTEIRDGRATLNLVGGEEYEFFVGTHNSNGWIQPEIDRMAVESGDDIDLTVQFQEPDGLLNITATLEDGSDPQFGFCHAWQEQGGFSGGELFGGNATVGLTIGTWYVGCDSFLGGTMYRSNEQVITLGDEEDISAEFVLNESNITIPEGFTGSWDVTGIGSFSLPGGTTVTIPANASGNGESATYSFIATPNVNLFQDKNTRSPFGWGWDFSVLDDSQQLANTFADNVSITMPYDEEILAEFGVTEDQITSKFFNEEAGAWQEGSVTVDMEANTVTILVDHFTTFAITSGGASTVLSSINNNADILTTPAADGGPQVTMFDENGNMLANFFAYSQALRAGIMAITADVDGDGFNEIVTVPTSGNVTSQVRVFNAAGQVLTQWFAYPTGYRGGAWITAADVDGDGKDEIIVTPKAGGPQVRVFDGENGTVQSQFWAYASTFRGGFSAGTGDVDGDGDVEIVTVPASNAGPHVRVFDKDGNVQSSFFAYASTIRGGYNLTVANVDDDSDADIVVSPKAGNGPQVAVLDNEGTALGRFMAYDAAFRGGRPSPT